MCSGCFPQAEQPAWPQLSKPQALGEDEEEAEGESGEGGRKLRGAEGRVAGLAKVRQAEAAGVWELSGKACAKCFGMKYHLTTRPPKAMGCSMPMCVHACGRARVGVCVYVCVWLCLLHTSVHESVCVFTCKWKATMILGNGA